MNIFQSPEWEEFRLKTGYGKSHRIGDILVLQRSLPMGRTMLYSPLVVSNQLSVNQLSVFVEKIREIGKENNSIFYRLELDIDMTEEQPASPSGGSSLQAIKQLGFKKSFEEMQPEHTLILDISKSEEEILAQMKQKGRYNIKIAQKNNIKISWSNSAGPELDQFFELYSTMAKRHGITYRSKDYFINLIEILGKSDYARVYTAKYQMEGREISLASMIATFYGDTAIYLYGGSSNDFRNVMAPYLLHWQVILDAKAKGCTTYDFFGIAPNDDPKHPWAGVTRFKQQFGGEERHTMGSYDLPLKPAEYSLFKMAEKIRRKI